MTANRNGKTGSRNPANKPTSVSSWKKSSQAAPVQLPSGNYMRIKKMGIRFFIQTGMMPNSLMSLVQKSIDKGKGSQEGPTDAEMLELLQDPQKLKDIADFFERMVVFVAEEPQVFPVPEDGVERDPELLYVDEIDFDDQSFIFQVVTGGTTELETFREEHQSTMASIRRRADLELPSE